MKQPLFAVISCLCLFTTLQAGVRSSLYPEDWKPAQPDANGHFLHDFSYAGYHKSELSVPHIQGKLTDVAAAPYNADKSGKTDATAAVQKAIDDVGAAGGGIVYLPAGTYQLHFQPQKEYCLLVHHSNVVLRGDGLDKSHLFIDETVTRQKVCLLVRPDQPAWWFLKTGGIDVTHDLPLPTCTIPLKSVDGFSIGQPIILKTDMTDDFIAELGMTGKWKTSMISLNGITLYRRIIGIDAAKNMLTIDTPTRFAMKMRDHVHVDNIADTALREVGLEDFSIGMKQNRNPVGWEEDAYDKPGNGSYDVHFGCAISFDHCEDCWGRAIGTYRPDGNDENVHIHSNGLRLSYSRQITICDCDFRYSQYRGGGGNGYLYMINCNDNLIRDCTAVAGRHDYDMQMMSCIGNVLHHNISKDPALASDFHMFFSTANLEDEMIEDGDFLECVYRPYGGSPVHGQTGSDNVFWNTTGLNYSKHKWIVQGKQLFNGYIIGTQGPCSAVSSDTTDFTELVGKSEQLEPQSLWIDQFHRRIGHPPATQP